ncbi:MFS transporter [Exilibacterium tricleocarpae]|uniref:MFS transporter n=1 Tax=Exilibacterium tricleocarpae TaxID=2591008 RepID=A0A545SST5_9GAMM|nr:MFS transporter [Exilibacterium tricleocarpae]TQV68023.1 MFS transporter [Exilibacterium tricleocarpae]
MEKPEVSGDKSHEKSKDSEKSLSIYQSIAYSLPHLSMFWLIAPIAVVQGIYAKYHGLSLTTIAAVLLVAKLFNAITDPIIGYYSDRYRAQKGTRKPYILIGGITFIFSSYFLYVPPENVTTFYFMFWFLAFYLTWTIMEIPHLVWAGEVVKNSTEKTRVYSVRTMAGYLGLLLFYVLPLLPIFETSEITPETLRYSVLAAGALLLPALFLCVKSVPDGYTSNLDKEKTPPLEILKTLAKNKPYVIFILAYVFSGFGAGMWYGLIFIYVDVYLEMGEEFAKIFLLAFFVGIISAPLWYKSATWIGKKATWALAVIILLTTFFYTGTLAPGEASLTELIVLKVLNTLAFTCIGILSPSMLSDIVDYSVLKFGRGIGGSYFAFQTLVTKTNSALASSLALAIAGWYGFDATATAHSEQSIFGLQLGIAWLPPIFAAVSLIFIALTPITEKKHAIIRRRLDALAERADRKVKDTDRGKEGLNIETSKASASASTS